MDEKVCPKCGSSNVIFNGISLMNQCTKCDYKWILSSEEETVEKEEEEYFRSLDKESLEMF